MVFYEGGLPGVVACPSASVRRGAPRGRWSRFNVANARLTLPSGGLASAHGDRILQRHLQLHARIPNEWCKRRIVGGFGYQRTEAAVPF
jgi:hypothetical protein